jgi:hypothetical protein
VQKKRSSAYVICQNITCCIYKASYLVNRTYGTHAQKKSEADSFFKIFPNRKLHQQLYKILKMRLNACIVGLCRGEVGVLWGDLGLCWGDVGMLWGCNMYMCCEFLDCWSMCI